MFFKFNALSVDSATQLLEKAEEMRLTSLKPVLGAQPDFGARLKQATQQRLTGYRATANAPANDGESFADKVKRAAQKHPKSHEQARKNAEKERARYRTKLPPPDDD